MRAVLDTCVLVPTVMRQCLCAAMGLALFDGVVSPRILKEWELAAQKRGPLDRVEADRAIATYKRNFTGSVKPTPKNLAHLWLPDPGDLHVLGLAVEQSADAIITVNAKDFPRDELFTYELKRITPDQLLCSVINCELHDKIAHILDAVQKQHAQMATKEIFAKAWLPQLGRKYTARS